MLASLPEALKQGAEEVLTLTSWDMLASIVTLILASAKASTWGILIYSWMAEIRNKIKLESIALKVWWVFKCGGKPSPKNASYSNGRINSCKCLVKHLILVKVGHSHPYYPSLCQNKVYIIFILTQKNSDATSFLGFC